MRPHRVRHFRPVFRVLGCLASGCEVRTHNRLRAFRATLTIVSANLSSAHFTQVVCGREIHCWHFTPLHFTPVRLSESAGQQPIRLQYPALN